MESVIKTPETSREEETVDRILGRVVQRPTSLVLTLKEQADIASAACQMLPDWSSGCGEKQVTLAVILGRMIEATVPRLAQFLIRLRYEEEVEALIVRGLPSEEQIVPLVALALSSMFGVPFNYSEQLGGALAMRIEPKAASAQNTNTTRDEFAAHTDDAAMPQELRVTWITLYGVRNPPHTLTGYAPIRPALAELPLQYRKPLWKPYFLIRMPLSFNLGEDIWSTPRPLLALDDQSMVNVAWPTYATRLVDPGNTDAAEALVRLRHLVDAHMAFVSLMPGTFFAFNNARGLHMRTPIGPGERLVFRTYVRPDLDALRLKSGLHRHVFPLASLI